MTGADGGDDDNAKVRQFQHHDDDDNDDDPDDDDDNSHQVQTRGQVVVSREELGWEGDSGQTWIGQCGIGRKQSQDRVKPQLLDRINCGAL